MSFLERFRRAANQGESVRESEAEKHCKKIEREQAWEQSLRDEADRRSNYKHYEEVEEEIKPLLESVGEETWGTGKFKIQRSTGQVINAEPIDKRRIYITPLSYKSVEVSIRSETVGTSGYRDSWFSHAEYTIILKHSMLGMSFDLIFYEDQKISGRYSKGRLEEALINAAKRGGPRSISGHLSTHWQGG